MSFMRLFHTSRFLPSAPLPVWLVGFSLLLGLGMGHTARDFMDTFNGGFGRALGEFALILMPSFVLAAAMTQHRVQTTGRAAVLAGPWAGAGMVCPDTAYAALSPIARRHKLSVAMGAYAGFKLLFPAGPLIVATGLGLGQDRLLWYGLLAFLPVWGVGLLWARWMQGDDGQPTGSAEAQPPEGNIWRLLSPFGLMALLLAFGHIRDLSDTVVADYLTQPKGALMAAALLALWSVPAATRRECLDAALRRTGALLLVIGAASAFGAVLLSTGVMDHLKLAGSGWTGLLSLFVLTALFKLMQGSSMATFAAVTPVAAAFLAETDIPSAAAVLAICAGSFVAILPNDSFYWLVRRDAMERASEWRSMAVLACGSCLQALTALAMVLLIVLNT